MKDTDVFDPTEHDRAAREEGWQEETEEICRRITERGDQRVGQLLINAVSPHVEFEEYPQPEKDPEEMSAEEVREGLTECTRVRRANEARIQKKLWSIEPPELMEALKQLDEEVRDE